jgi:hypothetical protein
MTMNAQVENDTRACRCPVRPYFTPGSFASGSQHETRLVDEWNMTHAHHPYAKARDELAGAMQAAESAVRSGEAVLQMAHEIVGADYTPPSRSR